MDLTHGKLRLRNATEQDAAQLAAWWNDGAVMAHAGFPYGLGTTAAKVAAQLRSDSDETVRRLILEYEASSIGELAYRNLGNHTAEIGIKICEAAYQERGIGRRVLSLLIRQLFAMGYAKIVLDTDLDNRRAQHVYEMLGFRRIGVRLKSWRDQLGRLRSAVDYALSETDFICFL